MARPKKLGLKSYPLDVDFFYDEKVVGIYGEFGCKGVTTLIYLLCAIYSEGYYARWNSLRAPLQRELSLSHGLVDQIVTRLAKSGFFDADMFAEHSVLTSVQIQKRFFAAARRRKLLDLEGLPYLLIDVQPKAKAAPAEDDASYDDSKFERMFFATSNHQRLREYCKASGITPRCLGDIVQQTLAKWKLTGQAHASYTDASRHMMSIVDKAIAGRGGMQPRRADTIPAPPRESEEQRREREERDRSDLEFQAHRARYSRLVPDAFTERAPIRFSDWMAQGFANIPDEECIQRIQTLKLHMQ